MGYALPVIDDFDYQSIRIMGEGGAFCKLKKPLAIFKRLNITDCYLKENVYFLKKSLPLSGASYRLQRQSFRGITHT